MSVSTSNSSKCSRGWQRISLTDAFESATKEHGVSLLIGMTTERMTKYELEYVDEIKGKGKDQGIEVYTYGV